ncbi:hypothetical protein HRR83_007399 [Exophiala dermatitidis]|uniref:Uncharacterized protein n=1 Tax=Exophiala dermatitidis TaxID=5970 RepID=A0AAN6EPG1_EXODE|nr:hypothetical protein HRR74_006845 [Exophiala dermatitidis]KAJ4510692.1 hypothetical protein HRR73_006764 [Exophiala dermatitidis]KAJ4534981.1 hypothetical protein HRR76_006883 [Exophiala dermatitidis]KAJ4536050.1 hypothetical protein HRR77_007496 [Exophiala dermatitidis]KAJ4571065.1 hypothetical protein HRR79_003979 [Exophiala dermatitidis]
MEKAQCWVTGIFTSHRIQIKDTLVSFISLQSFLLTVAEQNLVISSLTFGRPPYSKTIKMPLFRQLVVAPWTPFEVPRRPPYARNNQKAFVPAAGDGPISPFEVPRRRLYSYLGRW